MLIRTSKTKKPIAFGYEEKVRNQDSENIRLNRLKAQRPPEIIKGSQGEQYMEQRIKESPEGGIRRK